MDIEDFEDDFGFSMEDEDEVSSDDLEERLDRMHSAVLVLLNNLSKNPEKTIIKWPDRVERINEFKEKLERIRKGEY